MNASSSHTPLACSSPRRGHHCHHPIWSTVLKNKRSKLSWTYGNSMATLSISSTGMGFPMRNTSGNTALSLTMPSMLLPSSTGSIPPYHTSNQRYICVLCPLLSICPVVAPFVTACCCLALCSSFSLMIPFLSLPAELPSFLYGQTASFCYCRC